MGFNIITLPLASSGSTGNNTHNEVRLDDEFFAASVELIVEAVGAAPTVTFTVEGSTEGSEGQNPDTWYPVAYVTDSSNTLSVASVVSTTVGRKILFFADPGVRRYKFLRLVTSANNNVTYRAEVRLHS